MNSTIKIEHFASFRINKTIVKKNLKYLKHNLIVTNKKKRNEKFEEILSDITLCESDYEIWNGLSWSQFWFFYVYINHYLFGSYGFTKNNFNLNASFPLI